MKRVSVQERNGKVDKNTKEYKYTSTELLGNTGWDLRRGPNGKLRFINDPERGTYKTSLSK